MKFWIAALLVVSACPSVSETRPETADYIIETILIPSCGTASCHSTDSEAHNYDFSTIGGALVALRSTARGNQQLVVPGAPQQSRLVTILRDGSQIMPPEMPLADADVELITSWIADGAAGLE